MLLIADVHLGKVTHFRKYGAAIPANAAFQNLEKFTMICVNVNFLHCIKLAFTICSEKKLRNLKPYFIEILQKK